MRRVRIVVVGAGHLGSFHLAKLAANPQADLVGVVDTHLETLQRAMQTYGVRGSATLEDFSGGADAAVIAAPTTAHHSLGLRALRLGWHVFMEKPLASTVAQGRELVNVASSGGQILQVGHVERFNPAVHAALSLADTPRYIVTERLGPFSGRSADVDVVLDVMIHDLDIVSSMVPAALTEVRAIGVPVMTGEVDMASARLEFADGTVAQLSAGRASLDAVRKLRFFTKERYISVDCLHQQVKSVHRQWSADGSKWPVIEAEQVIVPKGDALALQDDNFVQCVAAKGQPRVDGNAGLRALEIAHCICAAITESGGILALQ